MSNKNSPGQRFRDAVASEHPLQVVGAINANHALLAKRAGFKAIYLSGGGVAAGSLGVPDLGITGLDDVLTDVRRITDVCDLPLLVDVDTGFEIDPQALGLKPGKYDIEVKSAAVTATTSRRSAPVPSARCRRQPRAWSPARE